MTARWNFRQTLANWFVAKPVSNWVWWHLQARRPMVFCYKVNVSLILLWNCCPNKVRSATLSGLINIHCAVANSYNCTQAPVASRKLKGWPEKLSALNSLGKNGLSFIFDFCNQLPKKSIFLSMSFDQRSGCCWSTKFTLKYLLWLFIPFNSIPQQSAVMW